jgi:hypothetical protein
MKRKQLIKRFVVTLIMAMLQLLPGAFVPTYAQSSRKDDIVFNSRGTPLAGATVRVCTMPATGQPCTPLALIYSDSALTQALANPTTSDGLGNYFFYAAPGKYMIEISGPGITTKQIPNVILPNDPASPSFTGGISAFSLTLGGNLTVNGNATVVGNFAGGTLTVTNQSTAPGTAAAGTVNVYAKSADKRLYYKDDTGVEVGPVGAGVQANVTNTFTAPQNFDADFHAKGPNPYYDVTRFGGYVANGVQTTTGSITVGTKNLTLTGAIDFANGHGILITGAGPATALATPTGVAVTPQSVTGATSYSYCVVAEDYAAGRTACSVAGSTTTGSATLGLLTAGTLSSCNRANGTVTCTTTAAHNLSVNSFINILRGSTADPSFETTATVITVPNSTTFTFGQIGALDATGTVTAGTLQAVARNLVQWNIVPYSVLRSYIYRCTTTCGTIGSNYVLAGVASGMDSSFFDQGFAVTASLIGNGDVPGTAPTSSSNQYLLSTITAGAGTTSLTINDAASNTVSGAIVVHDNGITIKNLCASMTASGTIVAPNSAYSFPISSTLNLSVCPIGTEFDFSANLVVNGTIIPRAESFMKGLPGQNTTQPGNFYSMKPLTIVSGNGFPLVYMLPGTSHDFSMENLVMVCNRAYQPCILQDEDSTGNNVTSVHYTNIHVGGNGFNTAYVLKGGFGFFWDYGGWGSNATSFASPPAALNTVNCGIGNSGQQLLGILYSHKTYNFGGLVIDACGVSPVASGPGHAYFEEMLGESMYGPLVRAVTGNNTVFNLTFVNSSYADFLGGQAVPVFDLTNSRVSSFRSFHTSCGNSNQPLFQINSANTYGGVEITSGFADNCLLGTNSAIVNYSQYVGASLSFSQNASVSYAMNIPLAPTVSNTAGTLASGTYFYRIVPTDANGLQGSPSNVSASCSSNGSQACVLTWTAVPGQASTTICRGLAANSIACASVGAAFQVPGAAFTDNLAQFNFSASLPAGSVGGSSVLGPNGVATPTLKMVGGGNVATMSGSFTASRTHTLPDNSGYVPVTSYLNSAYDNATRTNGAIGANWTVQQNGLNIASNQIQGTAAGASNSAFWNANPFSASQFAQATITALNGTTDFPGVTVLASGTAAGSTYYDCVENSANIYLQRIVNAASTNLTSAVSAGTAGDILRLEIAPSGALTCYKNGAAILSATDTQILSGSPGLLISGNVATLKNWSGGNLHPLNQMDIEADYTKVQHMNAGIGLGTETFTASPRAEQTVFLAGALASTWTGATWTLDKAITITRLQAQAKTAPAGCTTNAAVRLTDGTTPVNVTVAASANDSGAITQNYAAGAALQVLVQTAAAGCATSPADVNVVVQYRMQ